MKIVIINGSARKGNTLTAINAFIKGASEKNDSIRVSEIKRSAFPKSICPEIKMLRFRQTLHMIFDKGFVDRINVIRVKAYF